MNWKPGDTAIISEHAQLEDDHCRQYLGQSCVLEGYCGENILGVRHAWRVSIAGAGQFLVNEKCLRKPYDGNDKAEWGDCAWQPNELVVS